MFAVASLVTPFALGAAAGGIAAERVPVGNAAGNLITSWLNPTSILIGLLAVAFSAYLAAVYLAADAARRGETELVEAFRVRALGAGVVAGGLALAGLIVVHADDHPLYTGLVHGAALAVLILSVVVGTTTMGLDTARRFELARYTAALAVALVVADWAFARWPTLLPALRSTGPPPRTTRWWRSWWRCWRGPSCCSPPWPSCSPSPCEATSAPTAPRPTGRARRSKRRRTAAPGTHARRPARGRAADRRDRAAQLGRRGLGTRHRRDQSARVHPRGVRRARASVAGRGRLSLALCAERAPNARRGELSALSRTTNGRRRHACPITNAGPRIVARAGQAWLANA